MAAPPRKGPTTMPENATFFAPATPRPEAPPTGTAGRRCPLRSRPPRHRGTAHSNKGMTSIATIIVVSKAVPRVRTAAPMLTPAAAAAHTFLSSENSNNSATRRRRGRRCAAEEEEAPLQITTEAAVHLIAAFPSATARRCRKSCTTRGTSNRTFLSTPPRAIVRGTQPPARVLHRRHPHRLLLLCWPRVLGATRTQTLSSPTASHCAPTKGGGEEKLLLRSPLRAPLLSLSEDESLMISRLAAPMAVLANSSDRPLPPRHRC